MMDSEASPKPKTSGAAIASLVCGLFGCVPFVTSLAAIVLGFMGINKTKSPMVTGKGMAITGLILGVFGLLMWTGFAGLFAAGLMALKAGEPAKVVGEEFARDLGEGKVDAAAALAVDGMDRAKLDAGAEKLKPLGPVEKLTLLGVNIQTTNGATTYTISGLAYFKGTPRGFTMTLNKTGETYKVAEFDFP